MVVSTVVVMDEDRSLTHQRAVSSSAVLSDLATAVAALAAEDLEGIDSTALLAETATLRVLADQVEAEWLRRLGEVHVRGAAQSCGAPTTKAWVRGTLLMSPAGAARAVRTAVALRTTCTATADALAAGTVGLGQAEAVTRAITRLPSAVPAALRERGEALLLEHAGALDPVQTARAARHLAHTLDPDGVYRDEQEAIARSGITFASTLDGAGVVHGDLDAASLALIQAALDPLAAPQAAVDGLRDPRTAARRRLDALKTIAAHWIDCHPARRVEGCGTAGTAGAGRTRTPRAHLTVHVGVDTLTGRPGAPGGTLSFGGVISAPAVRALACDAAITRVVLSPLGQPLDVGRTTRVVPTAIRAALVARDGGCAFPGCDAPPERCDAHHIRHWADGGPTRLGNLVLLCSHHHHRVLHDQHPDRWTVHLDADAGRPVFTPPRWTRRRAVPLPPLRASTCRGPDG